MYQLKQMMYRQYLVMGSLNFEQVQWKPSNGVTVDFHAHSSGWKIPSGREVTLSWGSKIPTVVVVVVVVVVVIVAVVANGLPKSSINRLQVVQNFLARKIYPSVKRSDHISPVLYKLHWLPVSSRIYLPQSWPRLIQHQSVFSHGLVHFTW